MVPSLRMLAIWGTLRGYELLGLFGPLSLPSPSSVSLRCEMDSEGQDSKNGIRESRHQVY